MFKEKLLLGQYYPTDSPVHSLHASCKILVVILYATALFVANTWYYWGFLTLVCLAGILVSRIPFRSLWRGLKLVVLFCVIAVVLNIFFYPGDPLWQWGILTVNQGAFSHGLAIGLRLVLLVVFASLLTLTTTPIQLTDGIEDLLTPFRPLHIPAQEIAMMTSIALRFIPTLLDEFERIALAQRARGAKLGQGNLIRRTLSLLPLMVPLFVAAFRRAEDLAQAMEAKCYRGGTGRTRWKVTVWRHRDTVVLSLFGGILLVLIGLRIAL